MPMCWPYDRYWGYLCLWPKSILQATCPDDQFTRTSPRHSSYDKRCFNRSRPDHTSGSGADLNAVQPWSDMPPLATVRATIRSLSMRRPSVRCRALQPGRRPEHRRSRLLTAGEAGCVGKTAAIEIAAPPLLATGLLRAALLFAAPAVGSLPLVAPRRRHSNAIIRSSAIIIAWAAAIADLQNVTPVRLHCRRVRR
jgi:hypothetical protein